MDAPQPHIMRNLVLVKEVFLRGQKARRIGTNVDRIVALHHYDWTVEFLLRTISTDLKVDLPNDALMPIWDKVNPAFQKKTSSDLIYRDQMQEQRKLRNTAQHHGSIPSPDALQQFEDQTRIFLMDVLTKLYSTSLEALHLSDLIQDDRIRDMVRQGEKEKSDGHFDAAITHFKDGFNAGMERVDIAFYTTPESKLSSLDHYQELWTAEGAIGMMTNVITRILSDIDYRLILVARGTDLSDYFRYLKIVTPLFLNAPPEGTPGVSPEDIAFCENFVISEIVRWGL